MTTAARAVAVFALAFFTFAGPAAAGPPGRWSRVIEVGTGTTDQVDLARTANDVLNVIWTRDDESVLNTQISANASTVTGPHTVFAYEDGLAEGTALLPAPGGGLRAFFSGIVRRSDGGPHNIGTMSTATSADGVSWSVQPTSASNSSPAGRSKVWTGQPIGGTFFKNGTPMSVWGESAPDEHGYHVGTSDQTPDVRFGYPTESRDATVTSTNAATDGDTGQVAVGWDDHAVNRTLVRFVQPTTNPWFPPGPIINTPGGQAPHGLHQVAMTGRSGGAGGIFVAYLRGSDSPSGRPTVWRIGAPGPMALPSKPGGRFPGVAMGSDRRLWAFWAQAHEIGTGLSTSFVWQVFAARSNRQATRFGALVTINAPKDTSLDGLVGEGTAPGGGLDILALATRSNDTAHWHQRIRPGITLLPKLLGNGKVKFTTLDAGEPLNTTVKFAGKSKQTGNDGRVSFATEPGAQTARATRKGYTPAKKRVKVK